jgi:hypothetical protein
LCMLALTSSQPSSAICVICRFTLSTFAMGTIEDLYSQLLDICKTYITAGQALHGLVFVLTWAH